MIQFFKKSKKAINATVEKLESQQLKQVVGGDDPITTTGGVSAPTAIINTSRSNIKH